MNSVLSNVKRSNLAAPAARTATFNSLIFDRSDAQGAFAALVHVGADTGVLDGSNYLTLSFQQSDTTVDGDFAAVPADHVTTAFPVLNSQATYENKTVSGECLPSKRYVRVRAVETGTVNAVVGVTGLGAVVRHAPAGASSDGAAAT